MHRLSFILILVALASTLFACSGDESYEELEFYLYAETEIVEYVEYSDGELPLEEGDSPVFVYVCGAVHRPGVYQLTDSSRIFEAIEMAGGFTEDAAISFLNLARIVEDGEQIYAPTVEEVAALEDGSVFHWLESSRVSGNSANSSGKVNINQAGVEELMRLTGIGPSKAQSIVDYREQYGAFSQLEDVMNVSGIGEATFAKIKNDIIL